MFGGGAMLSKAVFVGLTVATLSSYSTHTYAQSWVTAVNDACAAALAERGRVPSYLQDSFVWLAKNEYLSSHSMRSAVERLNQITVPPNSVSDVRWLIDDLSQCANITEKIGNAYVARGGELCLQMVRANAVLPDLQQVVNKLGVPACLNVALARQEDWNRDREDWNRDRELYEKRKNKDDAMCRVKISDFLHYPLAVGSGDRVVTSPARFVRTALLRGIKVVTDGFESCFERVNSTSDTEKGTATLGLMAKSNCSGEVAAYVNGTKLSFPRGTPGVCGPCPTRGVFGNYDWSKGNSATFSVPIENFDPMKGYDVEFDFANSD